MEIRVTPYTEAQNELQLLQYLVSRGKITPDTYLQEQESVIKLAKLMREQAERMRQLRLKVTGG